MGDSQDEIDLAALDSAIDTAVAAGDADTAKLLSAVRGENARRRIANRELREKLAQLETDYRALEGKWTDEGGKLIQLQSDLDAERQARQALVERDEAAVQAAISRLPEKVRALVPKLPPSELRDWLDAAVPVLTQASVAPLEGQAGSVADRGSDVVAVGEAEASIARALGIDPQVLAKRVKEDGNKRF